jgi:hypothetical protein
MARHLYPRCSWLCKSHKAPGFFVPRKLASTPYHVDPGPAGLLAARSCAYSLAPSGAALLANGMLVQQPREKGTLPAFAWCKLIEQSPCLWINMDCHGISFPTRDRIMSFSGHFAVSPLVKTDALETIIACMPVCNKWYYYC